MFTVTRQGRIADIVREVRDVPSGVLPYAASTALTRVAQAGQKAVIAALPRVFDRPTRYTLNATRIEPSTVQTLAARVAVKDAAANNGTLPEDYLFPAVFGGGRKEKRFERAMRYAGVLQRGERAVLGTEAPVDAFGNLKRGEIQKILTATRSAFDPAQNRTSSRRSRASSNRAPYFAGRIRKTWGVWRREGRRVKPVLIFVNTTPQYRQRLDFEGLVRTEAERGFEAEFRRAAAAIVQRRRG